MNKITTLFSITGLLALTACTVDPVTDINAMEEAVLARQNELAAQSNTNATYNEESEDESEEYDDAQSEGENEGYEGSAEGDSSTDESGESEGADDTEQNEQNEAADQSDNSGTQDGDGDQTAGGVPSGVAATAWTAIQSYISQHFNAASVVEVEQEDGEIEVKLNSGHEVYFTLSGNYIRTEN